MSSSSKMLILFLALIFSAVQTQAFPGANAPTEKATTIAPADRTIIGTISQTMNASGYTYVHLENNGQELWAAIPATQVKIGDEIEIADGAVMSNFTSKTLGRTFESIIFSRGLVKQ